MIAAPINALHPPGTPGWLALTTEEILEPDLPIVDPHHHLMDDPAHRYLLDDFAADLNAGHNIRATVYIQCGSGYRADGPTALRPVGETEFVDSVCTPGDGAAAGECRIAAGIVGFADLSAGAAVRSVLSAHIAAGNGRFRGIRHITAWHDHPELINTAFPAPRGLMDDDGFRNGFAQLGPLGLSFDAWLYQTQLDEMLRLARAFPDTTIVLDHCGGPLRSGPYRSRPDDAFVSWTKSMRQLADCPNVSIKLGGLGMRKIGFDLFERARPASSQELAALWRPYVDTCVEAFGADRCMFESNFPVDQISYSYAVAWNAFKRLASGASEHEKELLFSGTAARVYRLAWNS